MESSSVTYIDMSQPERERVCVDFGVMAGIGNVLFEQLCIVMDPTHLWFLWP